MCQMCDAELQVPPEFEEASKGSESDLTGLLSCRVRKPGEIMRAGDMVFIKDQFHSLGFATEYDKYFAGQMVDTTMTGKVICKAL